MAAKAEQLLQQLNVPAAAGRLDNNCTDAFLRGLSKKNLGCSWEELAGILGVAAKDVEGENEQEKFEDVLQKWKEKNEDNCSYRVLIEVLPPEAAKSACLKLAQRAVGDDGVIENPPDGPDEDWASIEVPVLERQLDCACGVIENPSDGPDADW